EKAPKEIRDKLVVVNSSSQIFLSENDRYKKVINVHSYHPKLGSFAAYYLNPKRKTPLRKPASQ
ncbi:MAG: hypothetical protein AAF203_04100, partial [Pseudomonadota bacterium]